MAQVLTEQALINEAKLQQAITDGDLALAEELVNEDLGPAEVADVIESTPPRQREQIWSLLQDSMRTAVLPYLPESLQTDYLAMMTPQAIADGAAGIDSDDLVDVIKRLPDDISLQVLDALNDIDRVEIEPLLQYPEDVAGGLMTTDYVTVRANVSVDVVLRYLRALGELSSDLDALFVINRSGQYIGKLPLTMILTAQPEAMVREIMLDAEAIPADMPESDVALLFEQQDWISAPVVNQDNLLIGRITVDDVVDVIRESGEHSLLSMAGLDEEADTFEHVIPAAKSRAVWLGINLVTAVIAAAVIGQFQGTIQQLVALAVLSPIVASMGGVAGSQTLTLVIRALAVGQINSKNIPWLLLREAGVGSLNGLLWGVLIGAGTYLWQQDILLAAVICTATFTNLLVAKLSGAVLPIMLQKLGIDPALSGSVVLTTVTDVIGFLSFLGLATLVLL
ncbi:magnesium transporter [Salinibius halmophilus]|uniref:magnesium transporter n=1 Tax=Salinibius halmophilus TaxID=1853216 RepID=UPI000E66DF21|nr:magnesium transporter [Salinibius halmophilus]